MRGKRLRLSDCVYAMFLLSYGTFIRYKISGGEGGRNNRLMEEMRGKSMIFVTTPLRLSRLFVRNLRISVATTNKYMDQYCD